MLRKISDSHLLNNSSFQKYSAVIVRSFFLGGVNSAASILNVASFVFVVAYITDGGGFLSRWVSFSKNYYLVIAVFFLVTASLTYSALKNINFSLKKEINHAFYKKKKVKKDYYSLLKWYRSYGHQVVRCFFMLFLPPVVVIIASISVISVFYFQMALFALFNVVLVFIMFSMFITLTTAPDSEELVSPYSGFAIAILSATTLILPAAYLGITIEDASVDPALVVLLIFLLRYIFSFTRAALFSINRISFHTDLVSFLGRIRPGEQSIYLHEYKHALIHRDSFAKMTKEVRCKYKNNKIQLSGLTIFEKKYYSMKYQGRYIIQEDVFYNRKREDILSFLSKCNEKLLIIVSDKKHAKKLFGVDFQ